MSKLTFGWPAMRSPEELPPKGQHVLAVASNIYTVDRARKEIVLAWISGDDWCITDTQCGGEQAVTVHGWWELPSIPEELL